MVNEKDVVSVRLSEELLEKIDNMNEVLGFTKTRAEYVAKSIEAYFRSLVDNRLKIDKEIESLRKQYNIYPSTILSITKKVTNGYVNKIELDNGTKRQILIRIPSKLLKDIEDYRPYIELYDDLTDYIRAAVVFQLDSDEKMLEKLERVKEHRTFQKRNTDDVVNSILEKLFDEDSAPVMVDTINLILEEVTKEADSEDKTE